MTKNSIEKEFKMTEVAEFLGLHRHTVKNMIMKGELKKLDLESIYWYAYEHGRKEMKKEMIEYMKEFK